MSPWLFATAATFYGLAAGLYLLFIFGGRPRLATLARMALSVGFLIHLAEIGSQCLSGFHPVRNTAHVLSLASWLTTGAFLIATLRSSIAAVGAFVAPATLIALLSAHLAPNAAGWSEGTSRILGEVHIVLATLGLAAFALAAASSALYLLAENQIKHRRFGHLFQRAPALDTLDGVVHRSVRIGFPIFSTGLVLGAFWAAQRGEGAPRPEYVASVVAWCAFAALLVARMTAGWQGRRAAILALVGFGISALVVLMYLARSIS